MYISYANYLNFRVLSDFRKENYDYCYNGQISVDSKNQIIVGQHLTQSENDKTELKNALTDIKENTKELPDKLSLDCGYITLRKHHFS